METQKSNCLAEVTATYKTKVKPSDRVKISTSNDVYEQLKLIYNPDTIERHEEFVLLFLNRANKVLGWSKISSGGIAGTIVDPKIVFQMALLTNCSAIILSHNHPSGNVTPSREDISLTKKIKEGCRILDISLFDHLIMTSEGYYSFADEGAL